MVTIQQFRRGSRIASRGLVVIGLSLAVILATGCGKTKLGTDAYQWVATLDRVFEKRDPQQLSLAGEKIREDQRAGKLTDAEAAVLTALISRAESEDWERASRDARRLLAEQSDW